MLRATLLKLSEIGTAAIAQAAFPSLEDPLRMVFEKLGLLIFDKAHELEEQRRRAAGQAGQGMPTPRGIASSGITFTSKMTFKRQS
jgi:hypothetical protein